MTTSIGTIGDTLLRWVWSILLQIRPYLPYLRASMGPGSGLLSQINLFDDDYQDVLILSLGLLLVLGGLILHCYRIAVHLTPSSNPSIPRRDSWIALRRRWSRWFTLPGLVLIVLPRSQEESNSPTSLTPPRDDHFAEPEGVRAGMSDGDDRQSQASSQEFLSPPRRSPSTKTSLTNHSSDDTSTLSLQYTTVRHRGTHRGPPSPPPYL